jgi:hypothetical protein
MTTSVITNGNMITQYTTSMLTRARNISCHKSGLVKGENDSCFHPPIHFTNFTACISRFHTESENLLLLLHISHFNMSIIHPQQYLCPDTDKIVVAYQKGTRSWKTFPLYYLFTCTSCLYFKQYFNRPHAVKLLSWTAWPLKVGLMGWPETSVQNDQSQNSRDIETTVLYILHSIWYRTLTWIEHYIFFLNSSSERYGSPCNCA